MAAAKKATPKAMPAKTAAKKAAVPPQFLKQTKKAAPKKKS